MHSQTDFTLIDWTILVLYPLSFYIMTPYRLRVKLWDIIARRDPVSLPHFKGLVLQLILLGSLLYMRYASPGIHHFIVYPGMDAPTSTGNYTMDLPGSDTFLLICADKLYYSLEPKPLVRRPSLMSCLILMAGDIISTQARQSFREHCATNL